MKFLERSVFLTILVFSFGITLSGQVPVRTRANPTPGSIVSVKTPLPQPTPSRRRPTKDILDQKWPTQKTTYDIPSIDPTVEDLRAKLKKANTLIANKEFGAAIPILLDAEKASPNSFDVQVVLGGCLALIGRLEEAAIAYQKAVNLKPQSAFAHIALCQAMNDLSKTVEAVEQCSEGIRLEPKNMGYRRILANVYLNGHFLSDAIQLLGSATSSREDLGSMGLLGDAYFMNGDYLMAADIYEKIAITWPRVSLTQKRLSQVYDYLDRPADSIASARKLVELEPNLIAAHLNLGEKLQSNGFFDESIEALKKGMQVDPNSGDTALMLSKNYTIIGDRESALPYLRIAYRNLRRTATMAYELGDALVENGSITEAVEPLEFANKNAPNTPDIMRSLGLVYISMRRFDEGKTLLDTANQISPLPPGMTMKFFSSKDIAEKLSRFDEVKDFLKENPKDVNAHRFLISLYNFQGMVNEAEKQYMELIRQCPDDADTYNRLAVFYTENEQHEKAVEAVRKAIQLKPNHVFYMTLSSELRKLGRMEEALDASARAVEQKPESRFTRIRYGDLLLKMGRRNDALREYLVGFQIASGDPVPNFRLAWLYIKMGNKDGAIRHYEILKGIAPDRLKWLELGIKAQFGPQR